MRDKNDDKYIGDEKMKLNYNVAIDNTQNKINRKCVCVVYMKMSLCDRSGFDYLKLYEKSLRKSSMTHYENLTLKIM